MTGLNKRLRLVAAIFFIVVAALAIIKLPTLEFESDLLALFPKSDVGEKRDNLAREEAQKLVSDFVSNRLFLLVSAASLKEARHLAEDVSKLFLNSAAIETVELEQDTSRLDALLAMYRSYSANLLSKGDRDFIESKPDTYVKSRIRSIFLSPASLGSEAFVVDPFSTTDNFVKELTDIQGSELVFDEGVLYVEDSSKYYVLLQVSLTGSAFSLSTQTQVMTLLDKTKQLVSQKADAAFLANGALLFAESGSSQAKSEISTVGLGSLIGIVLLLFWAFRSTWVLLVSTIPMVLGVLTGILACQLVFGQIHIIAMVFGASLIGVSIDYTFHFLMARVSMSSEVSSEPWSKEAGLGRIFNGLTLGLVTSASAYGSFIFSGFPGFQQIALFSSAGLLAAYLAVVGIFPVLLSLPHQGVSHKALFVLCQQYLMKYQRLYSLKVMAPVALCLFSLYALGISQLTANDDIRNMQIPEARLVEAHKHFQALTGQKTAYPFFLVSGSTPQELLQRLEKLHFVLEPIVEGARSIAQWLPSVQTQVLNQSIFETALLTESESGSSRLSHFLSRLRVNDEVQSDIFERQKKQLGQFLEFEQGHPIVESLTQFPTYFKLNNHHYGLVLLKDSPKPDLLSNLAKVQEGVEWIDQVETTNSLLEEFRGKSTRLLVFAYLGIVCLLAFRYGIVGAFQVVLPPLLATLSTLTVFGFLGESINVFCVMALLLVLGIGIDYSLFLRESRESAHETLFAISLSGITTMLSFGLLALSQTQAISSFGLTILCGISCCYFFAPLVLAKKSSSSNYPSWIIK